MNCLKKVSLQNQRIDLLKEERAGVHGYREALWVRDVGA